MTKKTAQETAHSPLNLAKRGKPSPGIKIKGEATGRPQIIRVDDVRKL